MHKNRTEICGKIISIEESHTIPNDSFLRLLVQVPRLSGATDLVPFIVSERLIDKSIEVGSLIKSQGEMRTINRTEDNKSKLIVFNFAHVIEPLTKEEYIAVEDKNIVVLQGYVVKPPIYRETHKKRKIAELIIAHNRAYKKESYIPAITWGNDATFAQRLTVGAEVDVRARFQSRDFFKKDGSGHTTYELSVMAIDALVQQ